MKQEQQFVDLEDDDSNRKPTFKCWLPSGPDNKIPLSGMKVTGSRVLNPENKFYMLVLEQPDGEVVEMPVYKRDYRKCTTQWGKNPGQWGIVEVIRDGMRFALAPVEGQQAHTEEAIGK